MIKSLEWDQELSQVSSDQVTRLDIVESVTEVHEVGAQPVGGAEKSEKGEGGSSVAISSKTRPIIKKSTKPKKLQLEKAEVSF